MTHDQWRDVCIAHKSYPLSFQRGNKALLPGGATLTRPTIEFA